MGSSCFLLDGGGGVAWQGERFPTGRGRKQGGSSAGQKGTQGSCCLFNLLLNLESYILSQAFFPEKSFVHRRRAGVPFHK